MNAHERLGSLSNEYSTKAQEYHDIVVAAATAEAAHKHARAKSILAHRAAGAKSHAEAENSAEADDRIAALHMERLTTAAIEKAAQERLRQLRTAIDVGRSYLATERSVDLLHSRGGVT